MSKEYNSTLQARVEQFLKEKNISQAKAAPLMGISQTALSQYRRSMYDNGDIAALEGKLEEFFRTQEEQEASTEKALPYRPTQEYIPTSISEDVYKPHPPTASWRRAWSSPRGCRESARPRGPSGLCGKTPRPASTSRRRPAPAPWGTC